MRCEIIAYIKKNNVNTKHIKHTLLL